MCCQDISLKTKVCLWHTCRQLWFLPFTSYLLCLHFFFAKSCVSKTFSLHIHFFPSVPSLLSCRWVWRWVVPCGTVMSCLPAPSPRSLPGPTTSSAWPPSLRATSTSVAPTVVCLLVSLSISHSLNDMTFDLFWLFPYNIVLVKKWSLFWNNFTVTLGDRISMML